MKPGQLEQLLASTLEIDPATVRKAMRGLKQAGLLTSQGPGRRPAMTALDAARCLVWALVTDRPGFAPEAVRDFGGLPLHPAGPLFEGPAPENMATGTTFEAVLADLLRRRASPVDPSARRYIAEEAGAGRWHWVNAEVSVAPAEGYARIAAGAVRYDFTGPLQAFRRDAAGRRTAETTVERRWRSAIRQLRAIGPEQIGPIAVAVAEAGA